MVKSNFRLFNGKYISWAVFFSICLLLLTGCFSSNSKPLSICFSSDSTKIELNNVDRAGLWRLSSLESRDSLLKELVVVLQSPSEEDSLAMELPLSGYVTLTDSNVVFKPDSPFVKGREYLVVTHLNANFAELNDVFHGEMSTRVQPLQKLLVR